LDPWWNVNGLIGRFSSSRVQCRLIIAVRCPAGVRFRCHWTLSTQEMVVSGASRRAPGIETYAMTSLLPVSCPQARLAAHASCSPRCNALSASLRTLRVSQPLRRTRTICPSYRQSDNDGRPQQQQDRWQSDDFAPPRSSGDPPRLPPDDGQSPGPEGDGKGGMSNLTKAFVAGAFILGG
jgi:hypothetical protein